MIKTFRLKLTIYFVAISVIVYVLISACAVAFFKGVQTKSLDDRLYMLASEVGHAIDLSDGRDGQKPRLKDWHRHVTTNPVRGLASAQLFDIDGNLLEAFGPDGLHHFFKCAGEVKEDSHTYRVFYTPLKVKDRVVGYVQVNTATGDRDSSIASLLSTLCLVGPLVVIGLGLTSYYVSGIAAEPLLKNVAIMRRFIEDAGHELNTPLSVVRAKNEAIEHRLAVAGLPAPEIEAALRSVGRMEKIVTDLMYLTELDTEPLSGRFEIIDVAVLLRQLNDDFGARFQEKDVLLTINTDVQAKIHGEVDSLYRALSNVTENALKYTDKGAVEVKAFTEPGRVAISVVDTGIGIPEESRNRIFERFYRVDKSRSRASGGVGLGLSIVKLIVEGHKGNISVVSESGLGTQFILSFPQA
jgi:signal transduction histidine kinase